MTAPLSSISGLISGFNSQDLIDAIIKQARQPAARMESDIAQIKSRLTAINTYRGLLGTLQSAAKTLRDGSAFDSTSSITEIKTGTKALATVASSPTSVPGSYTLTVQSLARAEKLRGGTVAAADTALAYTGTFTVNGTAINVTAADSLNAIRDKINALNTGSTPLGVTASILSVSPTDQRLVLTAAKAGAAGIALADTSGTVLQNLGFLTAGGANAAGSVVVDGSDAHFTIDGVALTRTSNVVSDAIAGVTLTLVSDESGAETSIDIARSGESARASMQTFVDAYNKLTTFLKAQSSAGSSTPALYGDSLIRTARSGLPTLLLQTIGGAAGDLATAARAGLSLSRDGTLSLDGDTFAAAFKDRYTDLRALFMERLSSTGADTTLVSSGGNPNAGTYAVNVTAAATKATVSTSGFGGLYDDGGTADTITVLDNRSGKSAQVVLTTGMTTSDIATAFTSAFTTAGLSLDVATNGNDLSFTHKEYGALAGITVTTTGTGDGTPAFATDTTIYGTDVAGTIGGLAATGSGQLLVGNAGTTVAGLSVRYSGSTLGAAGSVTLNLGTGATVERLMNSFLDTGSSLDTRETQLQTKSDTLQKRVDDIDQRLVRRRALLVSQYAQMEATVARLRQQSSSLLGAVSNSSSNS